MSLRPYAIPFSRVIPTTKSYSNHDTMAPPYSTDPSHTHFVPSHPSSSSTPVTVIIPLADLKSPPNPPIPRSLQVQHVPFPPLEDPPKRCRLQEDAVQALDSKREDAMEKLTENQKVFCAGGVDSLGMDSNELGGFMEGLDKSQYIDCAYKDLADAEEVVIEAVEKQRLKAKGKL